MILRCSKKKVLKAMPNIDFNFVNLHRKENYNIYYTI